jgi:ACS family tartrate transporter-like MFS transporter
VLLRRARHEKQEHSASVFDAAAALGKPIKSADPARNSLPGNLQIAAMSDDKLFLKCAWRIIPFLTLLYVVNFLDRTNVGFAALTMNKDLGFSATAFGFGGGIFYLGYSVFQVPANVMLERIGARRWLFCILFLWGALSSSTALVRTEIGFYLLRFVLGLAEAGLVPGVFFYLTLWFPQSYRARFIASFMAAAPLSGVIGPVSGYILGLDDVLGLRGWQWLFLLEGLPACLLAFAVLKYLPDGPAAARWLNASEKQMIAGRLQSEAAGEEHRVLWRALLDVRVIALGLVNFGVLAGANGVSLWLPQIVKGVGFSNVVTGIIVALPNIISTVVMVLWGRSSDAKGERVWHVAIPALIAAASFLLGSLTQLDMVMLLALGLTQIMLWSAIAPLIALPSSFLAGSARAGGIALVVFIGQLGGLVGSYTIGKLKDMTGDYSASMAVIGLILVVSAGIALAFGRNTRSRQVTIQPSRAN